MKALVTGTVFLILIAGGAFFMYSYTSEQGKIVGRDPSLPDTSSIDDIGDNPATPPPSPSDGNPKNPSPVSPFPPPSLGGLPSQQGESGWKPITLPTVKEGLEDLIEEIPPKIAPILPPPPPSPEVEKDIAENLFPSQYREALTKVQDSFVQVGFMKAEDRIELSSEAEVLETLSLIVDVFAQKGFYPTREAAELAQKTIEEDFPKMWQLERERYRRRTSSLWFLPKPSEELTYYEEHRSNFIDGLFSVIFPQTAHAQTSGVYYVTIPTCWKLVGTGSGYPGYTLPWFCCNCGLFCAYGCTYYEDCGYFSAQCNVPLGCLNALSDGARYAVYSGLPGYEVENPFGWDPNIPKFPMQCGVLN